jgi:ribosomal protein S18 acetylase RimI-like enzyme
MERTAMQGNESKLKIRRMLDEDIPKVKVIDRSLSGPQRAISWQVEADVEAEVYRPALSFVAELNGVTVGFLLGDIRGVKYGKDMKGWIDMIGVHPKYQHLGIGRRLVETFCEVCEQNKVEVQVLLREDDEQLKKFFSMVNFRKGNMVNFVKESRTEW